MNCGVSSKETDWLATDVRRLYDQRYNKYTYLLTYRQSITGSVAQWHNKVAGRPFNGTNFTHKMALSTRIFTQYQQRGKYQSTHIGRGSSAWTPNLIFSKTVEPPTDRSTLRKHYSALNCRGFQLWQEGLAVASIARDAVIEMNPPLDDNAR